MASTHDASDVQVARGADVVLVVNVFGFVVAAAAVAAAADGFFVEGACAGRCKTVVAETRRAGVERPAGAGSEGRLMGDEGEVWWVEEDLLFEIEAEVEVWTCGERVVDELGILTARPAFWCRRSTGGGHGGGVAGAGVGVRRASQQL